MARQRKKVSGPPGTPAYMLTWGDMCTLMLCFFVMLLAMSEINPSKFMAVSFSFLDAFSGVLPSMPTIPFHEDILIPKLGGDEQAKRLAIEAQRRIRKAVKEEQLQDAIKVKVTDEGIAISVADPFGFDVGKADIKPEFMLILDEITRILSTMPESRIRVEGHTDNVPISTPQFPSNWDLSAARALSVVKSLALRGGVNPSKLSAVGYGEYRPLAPNDNAENRQKNRRIEIYVDYQKKETETKAQ